MEKEIRRFDSAVLRRVVAALKDLESRRGLMPVDKRFLTSLELLTQFDTVSMKLVMEVQESNDI